MVERAFSEELGEEVSAKVAYRKSMKGEITDKKAFHCIDPNCAIQLTCINFGEPKGKRFYFTTSCREALHNIDCSEITVADRKEQISTEHELAKKTIQKDGTIRMSQSLNKVASTIKTEVEDKSGIIVTNETNSTTKNGTIRETRNIYSLASFVELYYDPMIDNDWQQVRIKDELISLNELFVPSSETSVGNRIRIYMGVGKITIFKKTILKVVFSDFPENPIFTNKDRAMRQNKEIISKYVDSDEEIKIYFRGYFGKKDGKFKYLSFHEQSIYKDLFFSKLIQDTE
ncbi:hypothetical protein [Enterococcus faecalis]|uniref:hypothetical protein n=1 Tax=Enterococcus faecalis TaxID=1351 RepID=UPI00032D949E|nr:hypothetical protein [Enterococcus faecalis]EOI30456.1 hypothetical protein UE5_01867 [Enterococcus faecalis EnGen0249]EOJ23049.1 hypothetical protein UO1_01838 [Enterococcus faecalis EnGen0284]